MLILSQKIIDQIGQHALQSYPYECCGVLAGHLGDHKRVEQCYPARNIHHLQAQSRYQIDPKEYFQMDQIAQALGLQIIGIYHSHPDHPPQPSNFDLRNAWPSYSYLIVSIKDGRITEVKSWVLAEDGQSFEPEPVNIQGKEYAK